MKKNIPLDAALVHAAVHGMFFQCAKGLGLTMEQATDRAYWLKKQSASYVQRVSDEVVVIEAKAGCAKKRKARKE